MNTIKGMFDGMICLKKQLVVLFSVCLLIIFSCCILNAEQIFVKNFENFPAYPYNTGNYYRPTDGYVGCGPTTAAMVLGYFENTLGPGWLRPPIPSGINQGLETAWTLHQYMNTQPDGYGSVYYIKSGIEDYIEDFGFLDTPYSWGINVLIHVSPLYTPTDDTWDDYGPYGEAWMNDGYFWRINNYDEWYINAAAFCEWASEKLEEGVPIFLTIDDNNTEGGDHWVPMVGLDDETEEYFYYDTRSTTLKSGPIVYAARTPGGGDKAITFVRTITPIPFNPDLIVESIVTDPVNPQAYEPFKVYVTKKNQGSDFNGLFKCSFNSGMKPYSFYQYWYVNCLASGATTTKQFEVGGRSSGSYKISAKADSNNICLESNEENNSLIIDLEIGDSYLKPDLIIESIVTDPVNPQAYEPFKVYVTKKNQGSDFTEFFTCSFNSGAKPFSLDQYWSVNGGLAAGATTTKEFDVGGRSSDSYMLSAFADVNDNVEESDESNNSRFVPIEI